MVMANSKHKIATGNFQTQYIGCYGDGQRGNQSMDVQNPGERTGAADIVKHKNSNEFCIEICSTNNYTYAGMQASLCNYNQYNYSQRCVPKLSYHLTP